MYVWGTKYMQHGLGCFVGNLAVVDDEKGCTGLLV